MYQALYRKWRPKTFDDVVGQAHVSQTLKNQISSGRLTHAYLFVGTRGTGKTSCAKILAKAVNCLQPQNGNPCNTCASCQGIDNGSILDVLELDAASNNGVDNVRALREEAVFSPVDVKKRVYIIDEVHMLSNAAFNALLKILEEPPEHLVFILATTELHKVPATILSRCQRYMFKRIPAPDVANRLLDIAGRESIDLTDEAAGLLSRLADGSLRDALSLLDQCAAETTVDTERVLSAIGLTGGVEIAAVLNAVAEGDVPQALNRLDNLYVNGKVMSAVLEELLALVRDTLVMALMPNGGSGLLGGGYDIETLSGFAKRIPEQRLLNMLEILRQAILDVSKGTNGKLAAELCLIRLVGNHFEQSETQTTACVQPAVKTAPTPVKAVEAAPVQKPAQADISTKTQTSEEQPPLPDIASSAAVSPTLSTEDTADTQSAAPSSSSPETLWPDILERISSTIDMPLFLLLSDNASAVLNGEILTIKMKSIFAAKKVDVPPVTDAIKKTAASLLGKAVAIQFKQDTGGEPEANDKLDKLKQYSNIKFE